MHDWHPEDIKAAIRKKGISLAELARRHGVLPRALPVALTRPHSPGEAAIADYLSVPAHLIWPSRYDRRGRRLSPQPTANYSPAPRTECTGVEA